MVTSPNEWNILQWDEQTNDLRNYFAFSKFWNIYRQYLFIFVADARAYGKQTDEAELFLDRGILETTLEVYVRICSENSGQYQGFYDKKLKFAKLKRKA